jgi:hypothetical protein
MPQARVVTRKTRRRQLRQLADGLALQHLADPKALPKDLYPAVLGILVQAHEKPEAPRKKSA